MNRIIQDILTELRRFPHVKRLDNNRIQALIRAYNVGRNPKMHFAKKHLMPYYLQVKKTNCSLWHSWNIDEDLEQKLLSTIQVKPRRSASGVATISVITKPAPCNNQCLYCPNDIRMPKSYLHNEPACQRAERNYFDPYLQVICRAKTLYEMGHNIEKIELIILGGTWCDYSLDYQRWFIHELIRACNSIPIELNQNVELNTHGTCPKAYNTLEQHNAQERQDFYKACGINNTAKLIELESSSLQEQVDNGTLHYNRAINTLYKNNPSWQEAETIQTATQANIEQQQNINQHANNKIVGMVIETRPDTINVNTLALLRSYGCTKLQMGIQSTDPAILAINNRTTRTETVENAINLVRLFGFKIHTHFMINLPGSNPKADIDDYVHFVKHPPTTPDEVKLYPCSLVANSHLFSLYNNKKESCPWRPYSEQELINILSKDVINTPPYCRISRMIRDISSCDIVVGNKQTNLRQMVDKHLELHSEETIQEIRHREIATTSIDPSTLVLKTITYESAVSTEHFLQWVLPNNQIAGFLRLSLPKSEYILKLQNEFHQLLQHQYSKSNAHKIGNPLINVTNRQQSTNKNEYIKTTQSSSEKATSMTPSNNNTHDRVTIKTPISPPEQAAFEHNVASELLLPSSHELEKAAQALKPHTAMIREVHIYGPAANIGQKINGAQHVGLGKQLIAHAEELSRKAGYTKINVISATGTREYYKKLNYKDCGSYQQKTL